MRRRHKRLFLSDTGEEPQTRGIGSSLVRFEQEAKFRKTRMRRMKIM
jgi:hypothetical protein